jgi:hypothetical protein
VHIVTCMQAGYAVRCSHALQCKYACSLPVPYLSSLWPAGPIASGPSRQAEAQGEGRAVASECCQCPVPCDANRKQRHKGKERQAGRQAPPAHK